jgi:hypothetical protein
VEKEQLMKLVTSKESAHLVTLRQKHYNLDLKINEAVHTRQPDHVVTQLKKEKLKIKQEIESFNKNSDK